MKSSAYPSRCRLAALYAPLLSIALTTAVHAEQLTILHVGDMETWLVSAQGNLRDDTNQPISFYGGADRLASRLEQLRATNDIPGRTVLKLNAGDAILPGPRFNASIANLSTAFAGGQDYYDAIAMRALQFDASVFGNHEFDLGLATAARFTEVSTTAARPYLSFNINFAANPAFAALQSAGQVAPYKVFTTKGGFQVAVIGMTTPLNLTITSPEIIPLMDGFQGVSATNSETQNLLNLAANIQPVINGLRSGTLNGGEPVEVVVLLSHLQNYQREIQTVVPVLTGVDLVVSGGGHELTHVTTSVPGSSTIPTTTPVLGPALGSLSYPTFATDAASKQVPVVTGNFGYRYIGEITLDLDDTTGAVLSIVAARTNRVSGRTADSDVVTPNAALNASITAPLLSYIAALNAQIIGTTALPLNGERGVVGTFGSFVAGVRNAETNLGNLVADALRFFGAADVAIQNGGGIRASIAGPGNVSVGDTFNTLSFTNLLRRANSVNAAQLKDILEHTFAASTPTGSAQGRFPQISGMRVFYNTSNTARTTPGTGNRVQRVVLDEGGVVLIDGGVIVNPTYTFSLATIDFLAAGGDGYPFIANGVVFENAVNSITYQEALADYLQTPKADGGLARLNAADGDEVTSNYYPTQNVRDLHGRMVDLAIAVATPGTTLAGTPGRDTLSGTSGDDIITGGASGDTLTGGAGGDRFVYQTIRDAGDTIVDFTPYADTIDLSALLVSLGYLGQDFIDDGYVRFVDVIGGVSLQIDNDGLSGPASFRPFLTLKGITAAQIVPLRDFGPGA
jgi:5'-nucleotidase / UDP-sugar diphosphatase